MLCIFFSIFFSFFLYDAISLISYYWNPRLRVINPPRLLKINQHYSHFTPFVSKGLRFQTTCSTLTAIKRLMKLAVFPDPREFVKTHSLPLKWYDWQFRNVYIFCASLHMGKTVAKSYHTTLSYVVIKATLSCCKNYKKSLFGALKQVFKEIWRHFLNPWFCFSFNCKHMKLTSSRYLTILVVIFSIFLLRLMRKRMVHA